MKSNTPLRTGRFSGRKARRVALVALAALSTHAMAQTDGKSVTLTAMAPNPTGIQFGFWENQNYQYQTFATFGHRPTARVAIDAWNSIESDNPNKAGVYNWTNFDQTTIADLALTHEYGETIYAALNVSFTTNTSGSKRTIPMAYAQDITDPTTRAAAKNFITAYVNHVASRIGSFTLTIDYEIVSNYNLESTNGDRCQSTAPWYACRDKRADTWAAWFAEAAQTARNAAAAYNAANGTNVVVQVQPIVNGNVTDPTNAVNTGDKSWIPVMVGASDMVAMDNYHCNDGQPVTDADGEIAAIERWNTLIGSTPKRIVVAENGFSSGLTTTNNICEENNNTTGKYKGTPAEQAAYYADLFPKLKLATQAGGALRGRLQSFNIWSIIDNPLLQSQEATNSDYFFGVIAQPTTYGALGAPKPATPMVVAGISSFESNADLAPVIQTSSSDWTNKLATGAPVVFNGGADYSYLHYVGAPFGTTVACKANVTLASAATGDMLMIKVDGQDWIMTPLAASSVPALTSVPLSAAQCSGEGTKSLQIDVYVTGVSFPSKHVVTAITTTKQ